jgi:hypothetical protein
MSGLGKFNPSIWNRYLANLISLPCDEYYATPPPPFGSSAWFRAIEEKYGGIITGVKRNKVSRHDKRTKEELAFGGMVGGDRMRLHGYAGKYAEYLQPFLTKNDLILVEIGILGGTGLALWCDLFPKARIIGLDVDLGHVEKNMNKLRELGAFVYNEPELYEFDQLDTYGTFFEELLHGSKITICIDDAIHSDAATLYTLQNLMPYLSDNFIYFIEDNINVHKKIKTIYSNLIIDYMNELTILQKSYI